LRDEVPDGEVRDERLNTHSESGSMAARECAGAGAKVSMTIIGAPAVPATKVGPDGAMVGTVIAGICGRLGQRLVQQFASVAMSCLRLALAEQPIVADAVKSPVG